MAKKRAYQTYYRDKNGELRVQLVDAETGKPVTDKKNYTVIDSTEAQGEELTGTSADTKITDATVAPSKPSFTKYADQYFRGQHGNKGFKGDNSKNGESNNFGFINKPGWAKYASFVPGVGKFAAVANTAVNAVNTSAINEARKHLGLEPMSTKDVLKGLVTGVDEGAVGDVTVGKKSYGVSLNDPVIKDKTQLTVSEARVRKDIRAAQEKVAAHLEAAGFPARSKLHPELSPEAPTAPRSEDITNTSATEGPNSRSSLNYAKVTGGAAGVTKVQLDDGTEVSVKGDRAMRNNNPGNIMAGPFADSMGAIGNDFATPQDIAAGRNRGFAVFATREDGLKAQAGWFTKEARKHPDMTLGQAISKYAPAFENNTKAYTAALAAAGNITADTKLTDISPSQLSSLLDAQHQVEGNTKAHVYDTKMGLLGTMTSTGFMTPSDDYLGVKYDDDLNNPETIANLDKDLAAIDAKKSSFENYSKSFYSAVQRQPDPQSVANEARRDSVNRPGIAQMDNPMSPTSGMNTAAPGSTSSANFGRTDSPSSGRPSSTSFGNSLGGPSKGTASSNYGRGDSPSSGRVGGFGNVGSGAGTGMSGVGKAPGSTGNYSGKGGLNSPSEGAGRFGGTGLGTQPDKDKDKSKGYSGATGLGLGTFGGPR